jgi:hypothetical protein
MMSFDVLKALWAERDSRYVGYLSKPLTRRQINAVIEWRMSEARDVWGPDRSKALGIAASWEPPTPRSRKPWWE